MRTDGAATRGSRTAYFDVLRVVAIVGVVVLHSSAQQWYFTAPASVSWMTLNVFDSAMRFSVPIFFMVSGALFLDQTRTVTVRTILRKSLPRLLVAFIVWSVFYAIVNTFLFGKYTGMHDLFDKVVVGYYHQWFLWALMGLYLITPLLRRVCADRTMAAYFVALAFVFGSVLPLAAEIPIIGRDIALILPMAQVQFVLGFSVYFVLGHLLHAGALRAVKTRWFVIALMLAMLVTVAGTAIRSVPKGVAEATLYGYLTPNVILMSICVFMIVKRMVERRGPEWRVGPVAGFIGGCSFGIYLVHPFFQSLLLSWGITSAVLPEVLSVPLLSLAIFVPALVVAALLHRIPRFGRYIA